MNVLSGYIRSQVLLQTLGFIKQAYKASIDLGPDRFTHLSDFGFGCEMPEHEFVPVSCITAAIIV
jgi:hypothetical protein